MSRLEVEDLTVKYRSGRHERIAVDRVSFAVAAGGTLGIVGESGSGKTSLAGAVAGIVPTAGGRVSIGRRAAGRQLRRHPVQTVFQDPYGSLNPRMAVGDAIAEGVRAGGRSGAAVRTAVSEWLEAVGLDPRTASARPGGLSGGQCQRIAIARALAADPEVLIADEITSALDVSVQGSVLNLVRAKQRELGFTLVVISHNLAIVRFLAEDLAVMHEGRLVERGATQDVLSAPQDPYTRSLIDAVPVLGGSRPASNGDRQ